MTDNDKYRLQARAFIVETFKGVLTGEVVFKGPRTDEPAGEVVFELHNGRIQLDLDFAEGNLGSITSLWIEPIDEPVVRIFSVILCSGMFRRSSRGFR